MLYSRHVASIRLVSCPDYFSHAEGKNSLVNCLFNFCSVRFKNTRRPQPSHIVYSTSKIRLIITSRQLKVQFV